EIAELHERLDTIDGYTARSRAATLMSGLGFQENEHENPLAAFSGGWRIRLSLARTLMTPADLLLLDEPTNHLDLDAIIWLTDWIRHFQGTLLLISHDREFLDSSVDHIANLQHGTLELFRGNYSAFERVLAERLALQQASYEKQQREITHMQDFVRRFRAKATKARQAQSRLKALERMEVIAPAHVDSPFTFEITASDKISAPLVSMQDAELGYETTVLSNINLSLLPGDRYGLLGANGAGKSTLIKTLKGELPLLSGQRTDGANLKIGYFSQHQLDELDLQASAVNHIETLGRQINDIPTEQSIRSFLGGFNFHGDKALAPVSTFSGGEKARLALALITWRKPNLLLMDEPTNHLDLEMRQALTVALQSFAGALILVSHDQHLMTNTVDQFLLVDQGTAKPFAGDLEDYRARVLPSIRKPTETKPVSENPSASRPGKQARKMRTRLKTISTRIERLERKLSETETKLNDPEIYEDRDSPDLQILIRDQVSLKEELTQLEEEWLNLDIQLEST
ncbi:MAG: ATP-binding cassette domain-containing protein, partial [Gammaproteobacteria bacterium]|nr:ATP-binding cassette domain-containing protein [Gammaproteobacteria bacterium]